MRQPLCRTLAAIILAAFQAAVATAANDPVEGWASRCPESPAERFECLSRHELEHGGELAFDLELAEAARLSGRNAYAAIVLERVVLLHPAQAGAQLDLVIISLDIGDTLTAARHLRTLRSLPAPPPLVAMLLERLEQQLNPADAHFESAVRLSGNMGLGYDTNPNLGIYAGDIQLIIDGIPLLLTPDSSLAPQGDFFVGAALGAEYAYAPRGLLSATVMARGYDTMGDEDILAGSARLSHRWRERTIIEASAADFRTASGLYLSRVGGGLRQRFGQCQCLTAGLLLDLARGSEESSRATRLRFEMEALQRLDWGILLLYSALDYSLQPRATWGDTIGAEAGFSSLVSRGRVDASLDLSLYKGWDENAYSPLFGSRRRDVLRGTLRAGLSYPLAAGWSAFFEWSLSRQHSSVALFEYERQVSTLGLRMTF